MSARFAQNVRTADQIRENLMSGPERYRKILSVMLPAGAPGEIGEMAASESALEDSASESACQPGTTGETGGKTGRTTGETVGKTAATAGITGAMAAGATTRPLGWVA